MNNRPLISIVLPTRGNSAFINETIHSIISQTYTFFELLIIADFQKSANNSIELKIQDSRISIYYLSAVSNNPAIVRNKGIAAAKGEWIAFCDDDDLWDPQKLELQIAAAAKRKQIQLIASNANFIGEKRDSRKLTGQLKNLLNSIHFLPIKYRFCLFNCFILSSSMVKTSLFNQGNLFNESVAYIGHEDFEFWLRSIQSMHQTMIVSKKLVSYRLHHTQLSSAENPLYKKRSLEIFEEHYSMLDIIQKTIFKLRKTIYSISKY